MPGAFTPTEVLTAWEAGADVVKVFPADVVGPAFFKAMRGPLPQVKLMPTGGVDLTTAAEFLKAGACCLGVGSQLVDPKAVAAARLRPHHGPGAAVRRDREADREPQAHPRQRVSRIATCPTSSPSARRWSGWPRRTSSGWSRPASLDVEIGGAELNTAVGLARLGRSAAWVSRLPDNPLGRLIANRVREAGVGDRARAVRRRRPRAALYFLEFGAAPRASSILYDRKDSADRAGRRRACSTGRRSSRGAKWFHVTGITAALSAGAADGDGRGAARGEGGGAEHEHRPELPGEAVEPGGRRPGDGRAARRCATC